jgi:hypothetical protein
LRDAWMVSHGFTSRRALPTGGPHRATNTRPHNPSDSDDEEGDHLEQPALLVGHRMGQVEEL